jgi:ribosomal protein S12 methylthiotransferase accessory factor YcaO
VFRFCVSDGAMKLTTLHTNISNIVKEALIKRMYEYRLINCVVGALPVAEDIVPVKDIRHINTQHHIQIANVH